LNPGACVIDELRQPWHSGRQLEVFDALDMAAHKPPGFLARDFDGRR
jgi:hypothetical protein